MNAEPGLDAVARAELIVVARVVEARGEALNVRLDPLTDAQVLELILILNVQEQEVLRLIADVIGVRLAAAVALIDQVTSIELLSPELAERAEDDRGVRYLSFNMKRERREVLEPFELNRVWMPLHGLGALG